MCKIESGTERYYKKLVKMCVSSSQTNSRITVINQIVNTNIILHIKVLLGVLCEEMFRRHEKMCFVKCILSFACLFLASNVEAYVRGKIRRYIIFVRFFL